MPFLSILSVVAEERCLKGIDVEDLILIEKLHSGSISFVLFVEEGAVFESNCILPYLRTDIRKQPNLSRLARASIAVKETKQLSTMSMHTS